MKKHIVLSVNDNQDYLYYTPIVMWAWRYFGWEPILMYHRSSPNKDEQGNFNTLAFLEQLLVDNGVDTPKYIKSIDGYRSDTITQISRLYGAMTVKECSARDYFMTGDIDMLPLSNYWDATNKQNVRGQEVELWETRPTVWGHDLTGFGHYPICYIGMTQAHWHDVMRLTNWDGDRYEIQFGDFNAAIKRDLDTLPQAKDTDFYKYWFTDQDLITQRLNEYGKENITFINRGQGAHGYARGRVDRGSGGWILDQPELIDAHLIQQAHHKQERVRKILDLLSHVWPQEDFTWFVKYSEEFRRLTGHTA